MKNSHTVKAKATSMYQVFHPTIADNHHPAATIGFGIIVSHDEHIPQAVMSSPRRAPVPFIDEFKLKSWLCNLQNCAKTNETDL